MTARTVTILGATGSVGRSTLDLIGRNRELYQLVALTARKDVAGLARLALEFRPQLAVIGEESLLPELRQVLAGSDIETAGGAEAIVDAAGSGADWTMAAIVGCAGLKPVIRALEGGATVALANKEALVSAGELMMQAAAASGATLLPVDSEHNAVFQCFDRSQPGSVRRIILTASGGPFREASLEEMRKATPAQACAHPNWAMGAKISVDSATLMNKGLELIEAARLFPVDPEAIEIVIHAQSVVHSLVEYVDGSLLAQLGPADMRVPISYTLAWPGRMPTPCEPLDLATIAKLEFNVPDEGRFPALPLARSALRDGGAKPAILNAANEMAVAYFLENRIGFLDIVALVADTLAALDFPAPTSIEAVIELDGEARRRAVELAGRYVA
ncbi:MAG: 1-deoxy-D-xylulose-5-phosphate reductoisomerase [Sphingosinicella sp.]